MMCVAVNEEVPAELRPVLLRLRHTAPTRTASGGQRRVFISTLQGAHMVAREEVGGRGGSL